MLKSNPEKIKYAFRCTECGERVFEIPKRNHKMKGKVFGICQKCYLKNR